MTILHPNDEFELDATGFYYSIIASKEHPGTFGMSVRLKEEIQPEALQKACDKLFKRFPHLNVCLKRYFNRDVNLVLAKPIQIQKDIDPTNFTAYFEVGECTTRVLYGKDYFTVEVLHSVCDGGSLTKACKALTIEYFRQLGVNVPYMEIDLDEEESEEEIENAQKKYAKSNAEKEKFEEVKLYRVSGSLCKPILKQYQISISKLKALAKANGVTITEYMIAMLALEIDKDRKAHNGTRPIVISVPIDMRKYFPTKCMRNFVISENVIISSFSSKEDLLQQVHQQMKSFDFIETSRMLNASGDATQLKVELPYEERKKFVQYIEEHFSGGPVMTSVLSNVGIVRFPDEIKDRVNYLDFVLCPCPSVAYQLSCVTYGDILALSLSSAIKEVEIIDRFVEDLKS